MSSALFDLTDRVIVVTGARGFLGRPICAALADAGAALVTVDQVPLDNLDYRFADRRWGAIQDITDADGLGVLGDKVVGQWGPPDGLLLLHGIDAKPGQDATDPWRDWQAMLDVNLTGTMNACRVFGQSMIEAGRGSIVQVGSLYASHAPDQRMYSDGFTKPAAYSASKGGVVALMRWMAGAIGSRGVRVNCLSPGGIGSESTPAEFRERFEQRVPLGRMGTPSDLIGVIQFLLSDASAYITGQEIRVDGGAGLWP